MRFMLMCLLVLGIQFPSLLQAEELLFSNATVRQPLPGRTVSAGYFSVTNQSEEAVRLVAAHSAWFGKVELHQHTMIDGMMRMAKVDAIDVAPGHTVHLQPGGLHLMLFHPSQSLELGQQVPVEVISSAGTRFQLSAVVTRIPKQ